ncbi:beta-carotene 15,15'-dioxygenase, Brp/Blh family [Nocardioides sp. TRM66260-LWL]|uniref:beta-carotene 15,15'-dioxygenase, Brp/Blh family n=1 Tax=Nocardioides sp. TRM66260-LWL TaxID=2874478 RepID=UPI001CC73D12|nr:beta-carotene 15,15'-dioxygenase, Brp/Blh family [Nocardioides sp. TRM66260-LWL]MBZ5733765.1 beta-carotene 15,15'-dioxygenase, Brp/Blh family [Nocardioides sp. TRM66260-LWL]
MLRPVPAPVPASSPLRALRAGVIGSRRAALVGVGVGALLTGAAAVGLASGPAEALTWSLVGLGLLVGLPHGSIDHVLAARMTGWSLPVAAAAYGAVAAATWGLLHAPHGVGAATLVGVLALSLLHFGLGELEVFRADAAWHPAPAVAAALALAGTGALLVPLARAGDDLVGVATSISPTLGAVLSSPAARLGLIAVWGAALLVAVAAAWRAGRSDVARDLLLVAALGTLAPPLLAFAWWFGGWHGVRHLARLLGAEPGSARLLEREGVGPAARHLARIAAAPSLAAAATVVALLVLTARAGDPTAALGGTLVTLLALTVPHMAVVLWMDLRTWRTERTRRPAAGRALRPR